MKKNLELVYYGSTNVCRWEAEKFLNVSNRLGLTKFTDREINDFKEKLKTSEETGEVVYQSKPPAHAENNVPNAVSNESEPELTYTISKTDYELLMRLKQCNGCAIVPKSEPQIDDDVAENEYDHNEYDDILIQAAGGYQQQYADDSGYQDFGNCDQYPYEYNDYETMEGAVGDSLQKYDENENALEAVDKSNEWVDENGYGEDHLMEADEDCNTNNFSKRQNSVKKKCTRTWTDAGIYAVCNAM